MKLACEHPDCSASFTGARDAQWRQHLVEAARQGWRQQFLDDRGRIVILCPKHSDRRSWQVRKCARVEAGRPYVPTHWPPLPWGSLR